MKIKCRCGTVYNVKPEHSGRKMKCRKCDHQFVVPQAAQTGNPEPPPKTPPQPDSYWLKPGEGSAPKQKQRRSNKTSTPPPKQRLSKADKDQALLDHYSSGSSLEQRMAQRRRERIEDGRISNSVAFIFKGLCWFAAAGFFFWLCDYMENAEWGRVSRITAIFYLLVLLKAKYWLPPTLAFVGFFYIWNGIGSLMGKVDIDDQDDLPVC